MSATNPDTWSDDDEVTGDGGGGGGGGDASSKASTGLNPEEFYDLWERHKIADKVADLKSEVMAAAPDNHSIMLIGTTGSGKSTTINYLLGKPMEDVFDDETGVTKVASPQAVCSIGHQEAVSHTLVPQIVVDNAQKLSFIDTAGFKENRGPPMEMITAASLNKAVRHFPPNIDAVCFVVTWDGIWVDRCSILTDLDDSLLQLFGGREYIGAMKGFNPRIFYLITKAPKNAQIGHLATRLKRAHQEIGVELKKEGKGNGGASMVHLNRRRHIMKDVARYAAIIRPTGPQAAEQRTALLQRILSSKAADPRETVPSKILNAPLGDNVLYLARQLIADRQSKVRAALGSFAEAKRNFNSVQDVMSRKIQQLDQARNKLKSIREGRDLMETLQEDLEDAEEALAEAENRIEQARKEVTRLEREEDALMVRQADHRKKKDDKIKTDSSYTARSDNVWRSTESIYARCTFSTYEISMDNAKWESSPSVKDGSNGTKVFQASWELAKIPGSGSVRVTFYVFNHEQHAYEVETDEIERMLRNLKRKMESAERDLSDATSEKKECRQAIRDRKRDIRDNKKASEEVAEEFQAVVSKVEAEVKELNGQPGELLAAAQTAATEADASIARTIRSLALFITHPDFKSDLEELKRSQAQLEDDIAWINKLESMPRLVGMDGVDLSQVKASAEASSTAAEAMIF